MRDIGREGWILCELIGFLYLLVLHSFFFYCLDFSLKKKVVFYL